VQADEGPEGLEHNFFVAHVGNCVDQPDRVECELYVVTFSFENVQVVAHEVGTVLVVVVLNCREQQWVSCFYVVVDQVARKHTTLALREIELGNFLFKFAVVILIALRIVDVKDGASKA